MTNLWRRRVQVDYLINDVYHPSLGDLQVLVPLLGRPPNHVPLPSPVGVQEQPVSVGSPDTRPSLTPLELTPGEG